VNYYFGGKDKLYLEVWHRHLLGMRDTRLASINKVMSQSKGKPTLEDLLRSYANAFIEPLLDESRARRLMKLMVRETLDRHLPQNMFLKKMVMPVMTALQQALMQICPGLEESKAQLAILSIAAQLIHPVHIRAMLEQVDDAELPRFELGEIVNHVVAFSAAGIRAYAEGKTE